MPTVLISEPHLWDSPIQVGAHHYAQEFLNHGWKVVFVSQPLNLFRVITARHQAAFAKRYQYWRNGGKVLKDGKLLLYVPLFLLPVGRKLPLIVLNNISLLVFPRLRTVLASHGIKELDLLWINGNTDSFMLDDLSFRRSLVRVTDDYFGFKEYNSHLTVFLFKALRQVDLAICASEPVRQNLKAVRPDAIVIRNGVDFDHFAKDDLPEPEDIIGIPHPRAIYVGALLYWFDWDLLFEVSSLCNNVNFIIIGPLDSPSSISRLPPNVYLLGKRSYIEIPAYLRFSDVGIVPFRRTRLVDGISPIKVYEFLAAGLPVVATRWKELEQSEVPVLLADSPNDFANLILNQIIEAPGKKSIFQKFASENSWAVRFQEILDLCFPKGKAGT